MALVEPFMVKSQFEVGADTAVELEAKTGESLMIKDVILEGEDDTYVLLEIDKTTVGFFRAFGHLLGGHLSCGYGDYAYDKFLRGTQAKTSISLINYLVSKGFMDGYPVAEGQTFRVKPYTTGKKLNNVVIVYEKYDAGDIKADMPNGSESNEFIFVNYGRSSTNLTSSGDYEINTCVTTEEFPDFPFDASVPSKMEIEILGILGSEVINYSDANTYTQTKYLKMFKGRTCLFDRDKQGLPFYQPVFSGIGSGTYIARGISAVGNYTTKDRREPLILPQPLLFKGGEEVKVYITAGQATNTGEISAVWAEIAFIERVKILE